MKKIIFTLSLFTMLSLAGCSTKASKSDNASTTSSNASQTASEVTTTSKTNLKDSNSENTLDTSVNMLDSEESTFETHSLSLVIKNQQITLKITLRIITNKSRTRGKRKKTT